MEIGAAIFAILLLSSLFAAPIFAILWWQQRKRLVLAQKEHSEIIDQKDTEIHALSERLAPILSIELETERVLNDAQKDRAAAQAEAASIQRKVEEARSEYLEKRAKLDELVKEVAVFDERLSLAEHGVYEPHFDYTDSASYKKAIQEIRQVQKKMVSNKSAVNVPGNWTLDGSLAKGRTMLNRQTRLTLRAFNNECEAAIASTRWNNVNAMQKRIEKSADAIDRANSSMKLEINQAYKDFRLEELFLTHEYREKQKEEREEKSEMARAEREEKRLLTEARAAEKEEAKYQKLLEKARNEAMRNSDDDTLKAKIAELEASLKEAHSITERAKAMAERTKTGYVYIISNVGSFGEDIVKIGLTRRLNPDDRVKELGDASVPFGFDTHAIIYSDEAPALETALHNEFEQHRVNAANMRKEFFRIGLKEVEDAVERLAPDASFFSDREAREYQETLAMREQMLTTNNPIDEVKRFPSTI
jgi:hypothetical protein